MDYRVGQMEERYTGLCREFGWTSPAVRLVTRERREADQRQRDGERSEGLLDMVRHASTIKDLRLDPPVPVRLAKGWRALFPGRRG